MKQTMLPLPKIARGRRRVKADDPDDLNTRRRIYIAALLGVTMGWMALLMLASAWRNPSRPDVGPELGASLEPYLAHFAMFCILGILVSYDVIFMKVRQRVLLALMAASLIGLIWGTATEGYQIYMPTRDASLLDLLTNALGAATGGVLVVGAHRLTRLRT